MNVLIAEEVLRERGGSLSPEQLQEVVHLATGDAKAAEKAAQRRRLDTTPRG